MTTMKTCNSSEERRLGRQEDHHDPQRRVLSEGGEPGETLRRRSSTLRALSRGRSSRSTLIRITKNAEMATSTAVAVNTAPVLANASSTPARAGPREDRDALDAAGDRVGRGELARRPCEAGRECRLRRSERRRGDRCSDRQAVDDPWIALREDADGRRHHEGDARHVRQEQHAFSSRTGRRASRRTAKRAPQG